MKVDIEGAEFNLFNSLNMVIKNIDNIVGEYHVDGK